MRKAFYWVWEHRGAIGMIVFVLCLMAAFNIIQEQRLDDAKTAQIQACKRGNNLRIQLNDRGTVVQNFFSEAARTRRVQGDIAKSQGRTAEAAVNYEAADRYQESADSYNDVPLVDCYRSYETGRTVYING